MASNPVGAIQTRSPLILVPPASPASVPPEVVARLKAPDGVEFVPSEHVLLLAINLPNMTATQRRTAIGFAVEDQIAQGLDEVQVVLGPQTGQGTWLVAVIANAVLERYLAGKLAVRLWPDVLMLPVPEKGWAVLAIEGRVLFRLADGTGFATTPDSCLAFWKAAGSPPLLLCGGMTPPGLVGSARATLPVVPEPALMAFSLSQGRNGSIGQTTIPKGIRALASIVILAALGHLVLLGTDVVALNRIAGQREATLRELLKAPTDADLETTLARAIASSQPSDGAGLLPLLTRAFSALEDHAGQISVQDMRYTATEDMAVLTLEAADLATLQSVETALNDAGLAVTAGAATTGDGAARVQMTLRGAGA